METTQETLQQKPTAPQFTSVRVYRAGQCFIEIRYIPCTVQRFPSSLPPLDLTPFMPSS